MNEELNRGQVASALGNIERAVELFREAKRQLEKNGIYICGISTSLTERYGIHIWNGITELAEAVGDEATLDEESTNKELSFMHGGVNYFQIYVKGVGYREREASK